MYCSCLIPKVGVVDAISLSSVSYLILLSSRMCSWSMLVQRENCRPTKNVGLFRGFFLLPIEKVITSKRTLWLCLSVILTQRIEYIGLHM